MYDPGDPVVGGRMQKDDDVNALRRQLDGERLGRVLMDEIRARVEELRKEMALGATTRADSLATIREQFARYAGQLEGLIKLMDERDANTSRDLDDIREEAQRISDRVTAAEQVLSSRAGFQAELQELRVELRRLADKIETVEKRLADKIGEVEKTTATMSGAHQAQQAAQQQAAQQQKASDSSILGVVWGVIRKAFGWP
jgi:chromosome segregation ATPase